MQFGGKAVRLRKRSSTIRTPNIGSVTGLSCIGVAKREILRPSAIYTHPRQYARNNYRCKATCKSIGEYARNHESRASHRPPNKPIITK
jgi:hypothetical protein